MWNLYIVSHHPYLSGTLSLNFLEDKSIVDSIFWKWECWVCIQNTYRTCLLLPAIGLPVPTLHLHSLFHRQPEQTLENISHVMSLPRRCPSSGSQSLQLQKMRKSFGSLQHPSDRLGLPPLNLSLSRYFSDFPSALTLTGFLDGPCMYQASSHIRAFISDPPLPGPPSLRDGCMTDCWCLSSLCTDVTTSVKPHPKCDCWTWQLISYPLPPSSVSCSVCFSITLTTLWFSLGFTHLFILPWGNYRSAVLPRFFSPVQPQN